MADCEGLMTTNMRAIAPSVLRTASIVFLVVVCAVAADADELSRVGSGMAIVFSPDFADRENRQFYERLGFLYLESADWRIVVEQIRDHNADPAREPVRVLLVESHGTNGNGLKLQAGKSESAERSYISIGALQEKLADTGIEAVILSACNAGRLLRPEIYEVLDRKVDDPLFLPPTLGVIDASPKFERKRSRVRVLRRAQSNLESLLHGSTTELPEELRVRLHGTDEAWRFGVSTMLIQILTGDDELELVTEGFVREKSRVDLSHARSEELFQQFSHFLGSSATRAVTAEGPAPAVLLAVR